MVHVMLKSNCKTVLKIWATKIIKDFGICLSRRLLEFFHGLENVTRCLLRDILRQQDFTCNWCMYKLEYKVILGNIWLSSNWTLNRDVLNLKFAQCEICRAEVFLWLYGSLLLQTISYSSSHQLKKD